MWQDEITTIVRHLIDDVDSCDYTYSDDRIGTAILVAARLVNGEVRFSTTYTIDIGNGTLSPDPTDPRDDNFITLISLKTACFIMNSELKTRSCNAITVTDGPSTISMGGSLEGFKILAANACKAYEEAKLTFQVNGGSAGKAVLTPFSPASDYLGRTYGGHRSRY